MSGVRSVQKSVRELLHSRSAAASAVRVCALVVLAQSVLFVVRVPLAQYGERDDLTTMKVDTDDTARYRNATHVNGKALVSLLAELLGALRERIPPPDDAAQGAERLEVLRRASDDQYWALRRTLDQVLPEVKIIAPDAAPSDRPASAALPLPTRYISDLHKIVLFDQWLPVRELTVWLSPLTDSEEESRRLGSKQAMTSVCVTHAGRPQLAAAHAGDDIHWGLYGRGNDLKLAVAPPMWEFPERFGISVDSPQASDLAKIAFFEDVDLFLAANRDRSLFGALSTTVDAVLFEQPAPLRTICTGHLFLRLFGGKVTDLAGREVWYPADGGSTNGTILAALYYHKRLLQQVIDAKAGRNVTRN